MRLLAAVTALMLAAPSVALAQSLDYPRRLPTPGGEVIIPGPGGQRAHDEVGYAPARRAGDTLYVSGAIAYQSDGEGSDVAALETQVRRALNQLGQSLAAAGASFDDVAMINSYHVWESPFFTGTRRDQVEVIARVWREFSTGPRPAWTAVGTTGLLAPSGVIEIQLIAHSPAPAP